jgi:hypothetical protein
MIHLLTTSIAILALLQDAGQGCAILESPWTTAKEIWSMPFYRLGTNPGSAAASATHLYAVAENTNAPASLVDAGNGQLLGVRVSLTGEPNPRVLVSPEGHPRMSAPRIAVDDSGTMHIVWGVGHAVGRGVEETTYFDVWTSSYRGDRWTRPQRIVKLTESWWSGTLPSALVRAGNGDLHIVGPEYRIDGYRYPLHLARKDGRWTVLKSRVDIGTGYTALATRNDSLFMAFIGLKRLEDQVSTVYFRLSPDGGRTWTTPVRVSHSGTLAAREVDIVAERDGGIVITWARKGEPDDFFSSVLSMSRSRDMGRTWETRTDFRPSPQLYVMGSVEQTPGTTDVLFWAGNSAGVSRICDRTWGESLEIPVQLNPTGKAALVHPQGSTPLIIWSAVVAGPGKPRRVWLRSPLR